MSDQTKTDETETLPRGGEGLAGAPCSADLIARIAELEAANSRFCAAVAMWSLAYEAALDDCDQEAEKWKSEGDMYGWNFHEGMRSGWIGNDIALSKLKDLAHEYTGRELARDGAKTYQPNAELSDSPKETR